MKNLGTIKMLLKMIWKVNPKYYLIVIVSAIANVLDLLVSIALPKILLDLILNATDFKIQISTLIIFGITKYVLGLLVKTSEIRLISEKPILEKELMYEFSLKSMRLEYSNLEDPSVLDLRERAVYSVNFYGAVNQILQNLQELAMNISVILGLVFVLLNLSIVYTLILVVIVFFYLINYRIYQKKMLKYLEMVVPINRKYQYYMDIGIKDLHQKDFRLFDMSDMVSNQIHKFNIESMEIMKKIYRMNSISLSFQSVLNYGTKFISYIYITFRALTEKFGAKIGLGDFVLYINAAEKFSDSCIKTVQNLFDIFQTADILVPFKEFMELPENTEVYGIDEVGEIESIEFEDVVFSYPNSNRRILDGISFKINSGEKISIVGINNAGKSTIVKLICGFFRPNSGRILLNGKEITTYDHEEYMSMIAPVFQDFKLFPFTIRENIETKGSNLERVESVLKQADIYGAINNLPKGVDTHLEKSIYDDATDMSGGQKQKLAIARALYKNSKLVILDEPTAALDPLAESEVYEKFNELVEDKTAIFISHRMSSSTFCDKILLLDGGVIAAFDSHENLMKGHNLYRELFMAQANNFK